MRLLIALIIIVYLVGVGVILSPVIQSEWSTSPASELTRNIAKELPDALAWPVKVVRSLAAPAP